MHINFVHTKLGLQYLVYQFICLFLWLSGGSRVGSMGSMEPPFTPKHCWLCS